jgi:hypothetical protein
MSYLCEKCGAEFEELSEYKDHRVNHQLGRIPAKSVEELTGFEPPEMGVPGPTATGEQITAEPLQPTTAPTKAPWHEPEKLDLVYKYEGECPTCRNQVETLVLDDVLQKGEVTIKSKVIVVAWCNHCHKKLRQRIVTKL